MGFVALPVKYLPYVTIAIVGHFWWWTMWAPDERGRSHPLERLGRALQWLQSLIGEGNGLAGVVLITVICIVISIRNETNPNIPL
ncbi:hypothetical protein F5887DRAFT_988955 [Amanita rubescens]|nr:hypothetical protein F5887DRAFT_988955 [Amanita rubescens]